jgi:hypothetical protein
MAVAGSISKRLPTATLLSTGEYYYPEAEISSALDRRITLDT